MNHENQPPSCFPALVSLQVLSCVLWASVSFPLSCHILLSKFPRDSNACTFLPCSALPAEFIGRLRSKEATEGATVTLHCELSKAAPVEWRKGSETLRAGDRVSLRQDGAECELEIRELVLTDAGEYTCVCGQERTSAALTVAGEHGLAGSLGSLAWALLSSGSCAASVCRPCALCQSLCSVFSCLGSALHSDDLPWLTLVCGWNSHLIPLPSLS